MAAQLSQIEAILATANAEAAKVRSEAEADAARIRSDAEADAARNRSEAEAYAESTRAEAEQHANEARQKLTAAQEEALGLVDPHPARGQDAPHQLGQAQALGKRLGEALVAGACQPAPPGKGAFDPQEGGLAMAHAGRWLRLRSCTTLR